MYLLLCWSYLNHSLRFGKKSQLDYFPKSFSPSLTPIESLWRSDTHTPSLILSAALSPSTHTQTHTTTYIHTHTTFLHGIYGENTNVTRRVHSVTLSCVCSHPHTHTHTHTHKHTHTHTHTQRQTHTHCHVLLPLSPLKRVSAICKEDRERSLVW